jgi:hypothetical protein
MFLGFLESRRSPGHRSAACRVSLVVPFMLMGAGPVWSEEIVPDPSKHVIGATAMITETTTGISFPARIDTGAKSCSLHVEEVTIEDESPRRLRNIGKKITFVLKGEDGKTAKVETTIAGAVVVKSGVVQDGEYDRRYKVRLTLKWRDFAKEVLVTLNDRTDMTYPLLIGRNFLHGDFLVDVSHKEVD